MLIGGAKGSKILLTTRSDEVAEVSGRVHQHKLGDLSKEEALILFEKMAFGCNKDSENSNLVKIGKEIVRKCGGVPLAIRSDLKIGTFDLITMWIAQGFIQATTSNTDNVEDVANSYFADLLRRSFFQETEEHESFMQFYKMHDLIHDLAKEVADRDFFSITKTEDTEVVPEQTLYSSCLFKIDGSSTFPNSFYRKHMKLCAFIFLNQSSINVLSNSTLERMISSFSRLRLLHLGHLKIEFLPQSLGGLKHLRYLCISTWSIAILPNSITKLHNLEVLKLDDCRELKNLPRDIWRLVSLRRLVCRRCHSLTHIPRGLWQLKSLIHLNLDGCSSLEDMPPGIGQLTSLRTLTSVIMGKESSISGEASDMLNELKGLVDLRNILSIKFMGRVHAIGERTPTGVVKKMKHLRQLSVEFEYGNHSAVDTGADLMMLEALQPHQNIKILRIENYRYHHKIQKLPQVWKLPSLQILVLQNLGGLEGYDDKFMQPSKTPSDECYYFSCLKQLELQRINEKILKQILCPPPHHPSPLCNLKRLILHSVESLATMPKDLMSLPLWFRHFSATLKSIDLVSCPSFTTIPAWIGDFIALNRLEIANCRKLTSLPEGLRSLTALQTLNIFWCSSILMHRCKKEVGEDWPKIAHIPTVDIQDNYPFTFSWDSQFV
ncbi:hypothetical protein P3L10_011200 [Capsicum annuum]